MKKPKVLICVLSGVERTNWINPDLSTNIFQMSKDSRFEVSYYPVRDARPWEAARNLTIHAARQINADWLVSFDNDNFTRSNPLDIIASADKDKHIIGLTYGVGADAAQYKMYPSDGHGADDGPFREEAHVGGGVLMVRNTVWRKIPNPPWFRWEHGTNELLLPGPGMRGEDTYFCDLVRQHGFRVWTHRELLAGHYRTTDITGMVSTFAQMSGKR